jgi:hypothetical protein
VRAAGPAVLQRQLTLAQNVLLQGYAQTFSTVLQTSAIGSETVSCPPATFRVGDTLTSRPFGLFPWTVTSVTRGDGTDAEVLGAFAYADAVPMCAIISAGATYLWGAQAFFMGTCGRCAYPDNTTANALPAVVTFCTTYDIQRDNLPDWTTTQLEELQASFYGFSTFYQRLDFPAGAFPSIVLPPYGQSAAPPPTDTSVTPAKVCISQLCQVQSDAGAARQPQHMDLALPLRQRHLHFRRWRCRCRPQRHL